MSSRDDSTQLKGVEVEEETLLIERVERLENQVERLFGHADQLAEKELVHSDEIKMLRREVGK